MAKVNYAPGQAGMRGRFGRQVFKRLHGQDIVTRVGQPPTVPPSEAQLASRAEFAAAAAYARDVLADPLQAEACAREAARQQRPVNAMLIADYRTPPTIERIDDTAYHGSAGDLVRIVAIDDLEVVSVQVTLRNRQGAVMEQGPAKKLHDVWNYRTQATLPPGEPVTFEATATDRPVHPGQGSKTWMPGAGPGV